MYGMPQYSQQYDMPDHLMAMQTRRGGQGFGNTANPALLPPPGTRTTRPRMVGGAGPSGMNAARSTAGGRNLNAPISFRFPKTPLKDLDEQCGRIVQKLEIKSEDDPRYCSHTPCIFCLKMHPGAYCPIAWSLGSGCPEGKYTAEQLTQRRTLIHNSPTAPVMFSDAIAQAFTQAPDSPLPLMLCAEICALSEDVSMDTEGTLVVEDAILPSEPADIEAALHLASTQ